MSSEHIILNAVIDNLDIVKSLRNNISKLQKKNKKLKTKNKALKDIIYNSQYNAVSVKKEIIDFIDIIVICDKQWCIKVRRFCNGFL